MRHPSRPRLPKALRNAPVGGADYAVILEKAIMIRIARLESATDGLGQSSIGLNSGEWAEVARKRLSRSARPIERFIAGRPCICLGVALFAGITLGWWVKRQ